MENKLIEWIKEDMNKLENKIDSIESKVDQLLEFKFKVIGGTILTSIVLTFLFQILQLYFTKQ